MPVSKPLPGTTPVPNFFLDRVMPRLRDTEWRLLLVVLRQTVGWVAQDGGRKRADWLSHFQLKRRTGRSSAAVSRAVDVLVRSGLIIVRDSFGKALATPQDRRLSHSRLYFSIHSDIDQAALRLRFSRRRSPLSNSSSVSDRGPSRS